MKNNSLQINIPFNFIPQYDQIRKRINTSDLKGKGLLVGTPHITVRYGIETTDTEKIRKVCSTVFPFYIRLGKTSSFPPSVYSDEASVLKLDVISPQIHFLNKIVEDNLPVTESSFTSYIPHVTLAYVDPEMIDKYIGIDLLEGLEFIATKLTIVSRDNSEKDIICV